MLQTRYLRRCWVEIDLSRLQENYRCYRAALPPRSRIMAVIKADAYGHGDIPVARALAEVGVRLFAVSGLTEALRLRQADLAGEILLLGYTPPEEFPLLRTHRITQALIDEEYIQRVLAAAPAFPCQVALDTGMHRVGIPTRDPDRAAALIREVAARCPLTGLFTHLSVADSEEESDIRFTLAQLDAFRAVTDRVADLPLRYLHALNSAGGLRYASAMGERPLVRLGLLLYGVSPAPACPRPAGIRPVMCWKSVVAMVKSVQKGEAVGYGRAYIAPDARRIATLPVGYADGYQAKEGRVSIRGQSAPVVGRVCMDQMMVDVTEIPAVAPGDEVILMGDACPAEQMGVSPYQVLCAVSKRVPRIYKRRGE